MTWSTKPTFASGDFLTASELTVITNEVERVGNDWVAEQLQTASATSTGTETFGPTITFTATAGTRYRVEYDGPVQANNAATLSEFRLRYAAGTSVTSAGTLIRVTALHGMVANQNHQLTLAGSFVPGAGQCTVGVSVRWNAGGTSSQLNYSAGLAVGNLALYRVS